MSTPNLLLTQISSEQYKSLTIKNKTITLKTSKGTYTLSPYASITYTNSKGRITNAQSIAINLPLNDRLFIITYWILHREQAFLDSLYMGNPDLIYRDFTSIKEDAQESLSKIHLKNYTDEEEKASNHHEFHFPSIPFPVPSFGIFTLFLAFTILLASIFFVPQLFSSAINSLGNMTSDGNTSINSLYDNINTSFSFLPILMLIFVGGVLFSMLHLLRGWGRED
jgi:hypothetical protein